MELENHHLLDRLNENLDSASHTQLQLQIQEEQQPQDEPQPQQQPELLTSSSSSNATAAEFIPKSSAPTTASLAPSSTEPVPSVPCIGLMMDSIVNQLLVDDIHNGDQPQELDSTLAPAATKKSVLTEELKAKIVKQGEFYFSDANLRTDNYLMKFVRKDHEGFVPVPVVASFWKIKNLVRSHAVVATALRSSKQLVVSEDGKKVRRLHPLPDVDHEAVQSHTVVAENLPEDHSISSMEKLFGTVGNVKMVRICQAEGLNCVKQTPAKFMKTDIVVSNKLHALIEYESVEQAERAVSDLNDQRNWRSGLHVRLLLRKTNKHSHQQVTGTGVRKSSDHGEGNGGEEDAVPLSDATHGKVGEESLDSVDRSEELVGYENVNNEKDGGSKRGRGRGRGRGKGRGQFHPNVGRGQPAGTPPHANSFMSTETKPPPGPRMPDGTRGFTLGRGKSLPSDPT